MRIPFATRRSNLVAIALACALASCAGSPGSGAPVGEVSSALFANDQTIYDYFVGKGLTNFQAAGIVGNLDQESGGDPMAVQGGGPGRGIAQWSVGGRWDTDANDNLAAFAMGQSVWSLQVQLDFIWYELTTFPGFGLAELQATTNVTDATVVFQDKFEGCGTCAQSQRVSYAMDVLGAYGAGAGAGGSSANPTYAAKYVAQSWPLSSAPAVQLQTGQTMTGSIDLKNTGTATWTAGNVMLAPIPRDQPSAFQSPSWPSATRVSSVAADVAPGQTGHFEWDITPSQVGDFSPYFGLVAEGITWFADSGGPPDNDIQIHVIVTAGPGVGAGGAGPGAGGSGPSQGGSGPGAGGAGPGAGGSGPGPGGAGGSGPGPGGAGPGAGGSGPGAGGTSAGAGGSKMGAGGSGTAGSPAAGPGGASSGAAGATAGAGGMSTGAGGKAAGAGGKAGGSAGGAAKGGAAGAAAAVGAGGAAGVPGDAGAGGSSSDAPVVQDIGNSDSSGGCSAAPSSPSTPRALLGVGLALAALARRRRRS